MAEPLKNHFGPDQAPSLADAILRVYPEFPKDDFVAKALDGFEDLELMDRCRALATALEDTLPADRKKAISILMDSLGPPNPEAELKGMAVFSYMPYTIFVANEGLECYETSMKAQYEITQRFTCEFSIRRFLEHRTEDTLAYLKEWAKDESVHVRRLVSEGTRPRLPWAGRLRAFQKDPAPVLDLLEDLKDDPEEYVRRSVANNLNDISKDHPEIVVAVANRWWKDGDRNRRRLVRHGLRTLVKKGHAGALSVLGFGDDSPVVLGSVECTPDVASIGEKTAIQIHLSNPSDAPGAALVDFAVHFVKANGTTSPKVFKGGEVELEPGEKATIRKSVSLKQHTTRTHYPGEHKVTVQINGKMVEGSSFTLNP